MSISEVRTQLYLPRDQHTKLKEAARKRDVSMAQLVREAVAKYLDEGPGFGEIDDLEPDTYPTDSAWQALQIADSFADEGPDDMAHRHDEYLYGKVESE